MIEFTDEQKKNILKASNILYSWLEGKSVQHTELIAKVRYVVMVFLKEIKFTEDMLMEVVKKYEVEVGVKALPPKFIAKKQLDDDWFWKLKEDNSVSTAYFTRYERYLMKQGFFKKDIFNIKDIAEKILSHCANPQNVGSQEKRRGLVVGDVQSGKTANYLALINLAVDYGYNIVIILAGIPEDLRHQTQERLDEGVIGAYSDTIGNVIEYCGVGDKDYYGIPLTNRGNDFAKFVSSNLNAKIKDFRKPVFLVVKKNVSILKTVFEKLENEIKGYSVSSVLIIDDEADNASVSTAKPEFEPTRINGLIRQLFNKFPVASYVGFTATPFANVFINSEDDDPENLELFPADFICQLPTPSSYFGLEKVFGKNNDGSHSLRVLDSNEEGFFPEKHTKDYPFVVIADSLKEAIMTFLIGNVVRTLRGQKTKHRSMMINISRFNYPQAEILERIESYVQCLRNIIEQDQYKGTDEFIKNGEMRLMHSVFFSSFFDIARNGDQEKDIASISWEQIKDGVYDEIKQVQVTLVNISKQKRFRYEEYEDVGARVIVIGGYILSRGLTLDGLMVSYYSRNSLAYDTLLQMGRWFGYRDGYEDLCRIYMTEKNIKCFRAAADAVDDLKLQFAEMELANKTPSDFGLMVRESPDTLETRALLITARNKMRNSDTKAIYLNYGGVVADTSKIKLDADINKHNIDTFLAFKEQVGLYQENSDKKGYLYFTGIKKQDVADFISKLQIHYLNKKFDVDNLARYIAGSKEFPEWDVLIDTGNSNNQGRMAVLGYSGFYAPVRGFNISDDCDVAEVGKDKNTIVNPNRFNVGLDLTKEKKQEIIAWKKKLNPEKDYTDLSSTDYLERRKNPVLIICPLELRNIVDNEDDPNEKALYEGYNKHIYNIFGSDVPVMAFAIGFPGKKNNKVLVEYRLNQVKIQQLQNTIDEGDIEGDYDG